MEAHSVAPFVDVRSIGARKTATVTGCNDASADFQHREVPMAARRASRANAMLEHARPPGRGGPPYVMAQ